MKASSFIGAMVVALLGVSSPVAWAQGVPQMIKSLRPASQKAPASHEAPAARTTTPASHESATPVETVPEVAGGSCQGCEFMFPFMLGDFIGGFSPGPGPEPNRQPRAAARIFTRHLVADNNSVFPRSRAFYSYNFYSDAFDSNGNIHRNWLGGEWAFGGQRMSLELRGSLNRLINFPGASDMTEIGDLWTTFKYLLGQSPSTALSTGLAFGWPTGDTPGGLNQSNHHLVPFIAGLYTTPGSGWYLHGFSQLDMPTEEDDVVVLSFSGGIGYFLWENEDRGRAIVPTAELHLYTPIGNAGGFYRQLNYDDILNLTVGTTVILGPRATLATGFGFPVSEHEDYRMEYHVHLNWLFGGTR